MIFGVIAEKTVEPIQMFVITLVAKYVEVVMETV